MGSTRRKVVSNTKATNISDISGIDKVVQRHIEERNYLIFNIANNDVMQIEALHKWSAEALFQLLLANHLKVKKEESAQKTTRERGKLKTKR